MFLFPPQNIGKQKLYTPDWPIWPFKGLNKGASPFEEVLKGVKGIIVLEFDLLLQAFQLFSKGPGMTVHGRHTQRTIGVPFFCVHTRKVKQAQQPWLTIWPNISWRKHTSHSDDFVEGSLEKIVLNYWLV
jgi:hypothetical protein